MRPVCWGCLTEFWEVDYHTARFLLGSHVGGCPEVEFKMLDIDWSTTKSFTFSSVGKWVFKWPEGSRLVYVFFADTAQYAQEACCIQHDEELNYENAQAAAKRWIRSRYAFGTPAWNMARPTPRRRTSGMARLVDSPVQRKAVAIKEKAELLVAVADNKLTLQQAETRLRVMAGELPDYDYDSKLNAALSELARMYAPKSDIAVQSDDGVPF